MTPSIPVDGALGTTLQALGLPPNRPADAWVDLHPEQVQAVHAAFVEQGARVVRTATLCSRGHPDRLARAVELARSVHPDQVWLSIGPAPPGQCATEGLEAVVDTHADRVLLETFVDPEALTQAAAWLVERGLSVAASLVPGPEGLLSGKPYPTARLRHVGVDILGLNCGTDPHHALRAWERFRDDGDWFVAPAGGRGVAEVWHTLNGRVTYLGGCCGISPERWSRAWPS